MKIGTMYYDIHNNRYDVVFYDGSCLGGLRPGDGFEVRKESLNATIKPAWVPTSIQYREKHKENYGWFLTNLPKDIQLHGLTVCL